MDGWVDGWVDGPMDGWMDGPMEGWMAGCMYVRTDIRTYVCIYIYMYVCVYIYICKYIHIYLCTQTLQIVYVHLRIRKPRSARSWCWREEILRMHSNELAQSTSTFKDMPGLLRQPSKIN
jgi:hypothetical protein